LPPLTKGLEGVSNPPVACSTMERATWLRSAFFGYLGFIMMPHFRNATGSSAFSSSRVAMRRSLSLAHVARGIIDQRSHTYSSHAPNQQTSRALSPRGPSTVPRRSCAQVAQRKPVSFSVLCTTSPQYLLRQAKIFCVM